MHIDFNIDLAGYTTFGIHAKAACLATYDNIDELKSLLSNDLLPRPFFHIGEGSNLLFTKDFKGTILKCNDRQASFIIEPNGVVKVQASAGMSMDSLIVECCRKGLWGLENLSGIPGEVGASAVQNVGAYGVEAADVISEVEALDTIKSETVTFPTTEMKFGYRESVFKLAENKGRYVILSATFNLSRDFNPRLGYAHLRSMFSDDISDLTPMDVRDAIISMRDSKLPSTALYGSAGSFFKNPVITSERFDGLMKDNESLSIPHFIQHDGSVKIPAAWLIDQCGLKGATVGGAEVWQKQPLIIINKSGNATAEDVVTLESNIVSTVFRRFGITLSPEVEHIN